MMVKPSWSNELAPQLNTLAVKSDDLSSTSKNCTMEGEDQFPQTYLYECTRVKCTYISHTQTHIDTHMKKRNFKILVLIAKPFKVLPGS